MQMTLKLHPDGSASVTWKADTEEEGVALKEALIDALSGLPVDIPAELDDDQADRDALLGSCLDEAAAQGWSADV